jgi:hypothetical protein
MNRNSLTRTHTLLAAAAATGLALAGCGGSTAGSSSATTGSGGSASQPATSGGTSSVGTAGTVTGSAIFPLAVGNTWVYQEKLSTMQGTVTQQVASVSPGAGGERVIMKSRNDLSGIPHTTTSSTFIEHPDGSISVPLTQVGSTAITVKSGSIVWPGAAQLASGQPHPSTLVVAINEAGHTLTEKAHIVVRGAGTQTVHVPAGTYQATVVNETISVNVMGIAIGLDVRTWLAPGVGPVKTAVSSKQGPLSGGLTGEQVLKSFTKG